jgi:hypothetical protein
VRDGQLADGQHGRADRVGGWGILALIVGVAAAGGLWVAAGAFLRSQVVVHGSPPVCTGTKVVSADLDDDPYQSDPVPAMQLRPGMRCTVTVSVRNGGPAPVRVTQVVLPFMGPAGAAGAQVRTMDGRPARSLREPDGSRSIDALLPRADRVGAGDVVRFTVTYEFRPQGCDMGGTLWIRRTPTVVVSALGRRGDVDGDATTAFRSTHESDASPGCRQAARS